MDAPTLHVALESELPRELRVGGASALFVGGWCYCPQARIRALEFDVNGTRQPVSAHSMPRLDPFQALHPRLSADGAGNIERDPDSPDDPLLHSYRSGFWGVAALAATSVPGPLRLSLRAELEGGGQVSAELATIALVTGEAPVAVSWPQGASAPRVAIAMATYNPPRELLTRQLDSLRAQSHENWVCIVSDDCSSPEGYRELLEAIGQDARFVVSRSPRRLGFYHNFERALELVPAEAEFVAMADQDDDWHADKLATLIASLGDAQLVYSDARVVSREGELISETWWSQRANNHSDLLSLLVANSVTGAASLMRRDLLQAALPFPPAQFAHFHDHWIALVALARGDIAYVDRPLYDYVQHGSASLGHAGANQMTSLSERLRTPRPLAERVRMWRLHYFVDVCRLFQVATVLSLRCGDRMSRRKRRSLQLFMRGEHSWRSLAVLVARGARELVAPTPETLGAEWMLAHAVVWRRLLAWSARDRPQRRLRLDALPPPTLFAAPGRTGLDETVRGIEDKIAGLHWTLDPQAPPRVNLLIPTIDLQHFFGGYIAKFNLARRLHQRGLRVRLVTVDPVGPLPAGWRETLEGYSGLRGFFADVEVAFGRESGGVPVNPDDLFIATTWWTAHIASSAGALTGRQRFLYLIQEYEPFTFPMGSYAALAAESYTFAHVALFSSELLRGYFRAHGIGVYADGRRAGDEASASFENAITPVRAPTLDELARREIRRLLVYARPEPHAARNMYELGLLALGRALRQGAFEYGWELHGIGSVSGRRRISLGGGAALELLPRSDQSSYGAMLREHDVGLALMYTPHPSLVPIEMASAGMLTVTNSFENKTAAELTAISPNLIAAQPTVASIAEALVQASGAATDFPRRIAGSEVAWSQDWERSFSDELLDRVLAEVLGATAAASGPR